MIGDDGAGNQIGMAPGAKWIACRMLDEEANGTDANIHRVHGIFPGALPGGWRPKPGRPDQSA